MRNTAANHVEPACVSACVDERGRRSRWRVDAMGDVMVGDDEDVVVPGWGGLLVGLAVVGVGVQSAIVGLQVLGGACVVTSSVVLYVWRRRGRGQGVRKCRIVRDTDAVWGATDV